MYKVNAYCLNCGNFGEGLEIEQENLVEDTPCPNCKCVMLVRVPDFKSLLDFHAFRTSILVQSEEE